MISYCSLVRTESCWKEDSWNSSVALFAASHKFQHGTLCASAFGALRGRPPSNGAIIGNARQATSEGKSGLVETGLTGPAATTL